MTPLVPNPMNQLARVGVSLLAIYWGIVGLHQVAEAVTAWFGWSDFRDRGAFRSLVSSVGATILAVSLVSLLPSWLLFRNRELVAERIAPLNDASAPIAIRAQEALWVGCVLLALTLALHGLTGVAASAFILTASLAALEQGEVRDGQLVRFGGSFAASVINLAAAGLLWRHARSLGAKLAA